MKAYVIVDIDVTDPEPFMEYANKVSELLARYGAEYLVRGAQPEAFLEKGSTPQHVVVIEFPTRESAEAFFKERQEVGLAEMFNSSTSSRILLADGVD